MEFSTPFPDGYMNSVLRLAGWRESDVMEIREILIKEIKEQNKNEH